MRFAHGETATILRDGGRNAHGDPLPGVEYSIEGWAFAPRGSSETDERGQAVIVGLVGYGPYGADVTADDRMRVCGVVYDVEGEPGQWRNPLTGHEFGVQVALTRAD